MTDAYRNGQLKAMVREILDAAAQPMSFPEIAERIGAETRSRRVSLYEVLTKLTRRGDIARTRRMYAQWYSLRSKAEAAD